MGNPLEEEVNRIKRQEYAQAEKTIEKVYSALAAVPNKRMPYDVYKELFEPVFLGEVPITNDNMYLIGRFISYAGGPKSPVDIVKDGVVVATIPGIIHKTPHEMLEKIPVNFDSLKSKHEVMTRLGRGTMSQRLVNAASDAISDTVKSEFEERLLEVLDDDTTEVKSTDISYEIYDD
jgi:hypothetical protein